jgi:TonB family protein
MPLRNLGFLLFVGLAPTIGLASVQGRVSQTPGGRMSLTEREGQIWTAAVHDSQFAAVLHSTAQANCAATQAPEALATPNPLLQKPELNSKITVSFIIGTDGLVHSPLILESAGAAPDHAVLNAVRSWRYRPAMCNGVPTEAEGKIEFTGR